MIINDAGTYTLKYTATDSCGKTTEVERELVVAEPVHVYGAEWDGSTSSVLTRTDLSADFADPVAQYSDGNGGWVGGSSPFDDIYPWSGMQIVEDAEAGTLVSIPKFYYKWTHGLGNDGKGLKLQISDTPQDGFFTSPAHADRGDGVGERDVVYVGRYHCASNDYKSKSGVLAITNKYIDDFRTGILALGQGIYQNDFAMFWTIRMLYLVEFADWNSQAKIGYGCGNGSTQEAMGSTDAMPYHTGTSTTGRNVPGEVQYRNIEGLWSNVYDNVDGIYYDSASVYVVNNPNNFSPDPIGVLVGARSTRSGLITSFTDPTQSGFEYALYPNGRSASSDFTIYVCDNCAYNANNVEMYTGGSYVSASVSDMSGLFSFVGASFGSRAVNVGSRLMKLPSA